MNKIILASASPRRKDILSKFDLEIEVISSDIEEVVRKNEKPEQVAMSLAFQKAQDIASKFSNNEIILAADTIVYKDRILGKPSNDEEALEMLKSLNGEEHFVITGLSIIQAGSLKKIIDFSKTKVKFKKSTEDKLKSYIKTGEHRDKAGSYAIQGYGSVLVDYIEGSYSNVVGLPIDRVDYLLEKYFDFKLF